MPRYSFTITPEHPEGQFKQDSFDHLMQLGVSAPGLDLGHRHTLIGAQVDPEGRWANLTIETEPMAPTRQLRGAFRIVNGTPTAKVVCLLHENPGQELARLQLDAPLQAGQRVALGEQEFVVTGTQYPLRDPNTGVCTSGIDWQHAHLAPVAPISECPQLVDAPIRHTTALRSVPPALPPSAG